jgi:hypothetical protein
MGFQWFFFVLVEAGLPFDSLFLVFFKVFLAHARPAADSATTDMMSKGGQVSLPLS